MRPAFTSQENLAHLLDDAANAISHGDSFEGCVVWELRRAPPDDQSAFAVRAVYRVGNSLGQGGVVLVGDHDGLQPQEPWGALRALLKAAQEHIACQDCRGAGRLGDPIRGVECVCRESLREAATATRGLLDRQGDYLAEMQRLGVDTAAA